MSKTDEELFFRALEIPPDEREEFLRKECEGDEELRREVENLLKKDQAEPSSIIDSPCHELGSIEKEWFANLDSAVGGLPEITAKSGDEVFYFGDYEIEEEIGQGSMGVVYRAEQRSLKRKVAIKMIRPMFTLSDVELARFWQEAETAASLENPNIVSVYEVGEHQGQYYYSMRLFEGGTLTSKMDELNADKRAVARLMIKVCRAVHVAHQRGILHRDIKPGNILFDEDGEPHITDFGLAKQIERVGGLTHSGQLLGTPNYMAPEQAAGRVDEISTVTDVYSLGAVLYELVTGKRPHNSDSLMETLSLVANADPPAPRELVADIDRDLETIVLKAVSKRPIDRYQSARAIADDLEKWLRGEPMTARPVNSVERLIKWGRRKPYRVFFGSVAALSLLGIAIEYVWHLRSVAELERRGREEAEAVAYWANIQAAFGLLEAKQHAEAFRALRNIPSNRRDWEWRYLRGNIDRSEWFFRLPGQHIKFAAFQNGGKRIAAISNTGVISIIERDTRKVIGTQTEMRGNPVAINSTGSHVLVRREESYELWEVADGRFVSSFPSLRGNSARSPTAEQYVFGGYTKSGRYAVSPDGRFIAAISATDHREVDLYEVGKSEPIRSFPCNHGHGCSFTGGGEWFVYSSGAQTHFWDFNARKVARPPLITDLVARHHTDRSRSVLVTSAFGKLRAWDLDTARSKLLISSLSLGHRFCFSNDGKHLLVVRRLGRLQLWDPRSGELSREFGFYDRGGEIGPCNWHESEILIHTTVGADSELRIWNCAQPEELVLRGHASSARSSVRNSSSVLSFDTSRNALCGAAEASFSMIHQVPYTIPLSSPPYANILNPVLRSIAP